MFWNSVCQVTGVFTRLKGLHMEMAAEMGVLGPSSPRYLTRMFAACIKGTRYSTGNATTVGTRFGGFKEATQRHV